MPEDGFESGGTTVGGAAVIDASLLPPISGSRSVVVVPRDSPFSGPAIIKTGVLTVRLAVAPGDTVVRVALQPFASVQDYAIPRGMWVRVAIPGGPIVPLPLPPSETLTTRAALPFAGPSGEMWFGPVRTEQIPLPPGGASEVVFQAGPAPPIPGCGNFYGTAGYLIDDLRVE
jgi:hypothetical protein